MTSMDQKLCIICTIAGCEKKKKKKKKKKNYSWVRGDFLGPPHGTTPAAVITNKNENCRTFKSKEDIRKKEAGPYLGFVY